MGINKIKRALPVVKKYLEMDEKLRDSDNKLVCRIWNNFLWEKEINCKELSAYALLCLVATDELPSFESISRARRKIQEQHPELRGKNYKQRKNEQLTTRTNIKGIFSEKP